MSDDSARTNLLTFIGGTPAQLVQGNAIGRDTQSVTNPTTVHEAAWLVAAAHAIELRRSDVIDDAGLSAIGRSLLSARSAPEMAGEGARSLIEDLDARVESQMPASVSGAATLGLAREEWLATVSRIAWRSTALAILGHLDLVREAVLVLAETHLVTIMPAFLGGRPAQPTTLAHYLGPVFGALDTANDRIVQAFGYLDRSPLGSGMLAGDVLEANRDDLAARLGFAGVVPNTLDALANVEDTIALTDAIGSALAPIGRFVRDVRTWIRTDPMSLVLDEGWTTIPEPAHPVLTLARRLDALELQLTLIEHDLDGCRRQWRRFDYGPLGEAFNHLIAAASSIGATVPDVLDTARELFSTGLIVNRAYLGNRAGRGYSTATDLSVFLMTEEQIPPAAARRIAVLVLAQLQKMSVEVSGITPDMIDSAALVTIGREIKVEIEALGRFLAPRRFIERRQVTGSPASGSSWNARA
jgi:argininosuccinate lyase